MLFVFIVILLSIYVILDWALKKEGGKNAHTHQTLLVPASRSSFPTLHCPGLRLLRRLFLDTRCGQETKRSPLEKRPKWQQLWGQTFPTQVLFPNPIPLMYIVLRNFAVSKENRLWPWSHARLGRGLRRPHNVESRARFVLSRYRRRRETNLPFDRRQLVGEGMPIRFLAGHYLPTAVGVGVGLEGVHRANAGLKTELQLAAAGHVQKPVKQVG